ncbi:MAG TPA: hypothetical protein VMT46_15245 [Anaerolineaceae bacterium]|nr:hypothetical protein [Anaerolineaceae bacterium]
MNFNQSSLLKSVAIAGVAIGVLSSIPLVNCVNCLLLAWVWGGGILAVYLYRNYEKVAYVPTTQAMILGALAGAIGAVVGGILSLVFGGLTAGVTQALSQMAGQNGVNVPDFILTSGFSILSIFINIIVYAVVGGIGGLIASGLIWKEPAGPTSSVPPSAQTPSGPTA